MDLKRFLNSEPHFHPDKNVVRGVDLTNVSRMGNMGMKPAARAIFQKSTSEPVPVQKRIRSDSVCSEGDPVSPSTASPTSISFPTTGFMAQAFQANPRPNSGDKALKYEFDPKWN